MTDQDKWGHSSQLLPKTNTVVFYNNHGYIFAAVLDVGILRDINLQHSVAQQSAFNHSTLVLYT